ncbi:MAG: SAF domain-containing protein [Clostridia bacterium]|nr:SAF domain-containing protein [Clostridia bacterium]MDD4386470.1 SAF domain-containing protein [Clostridia bacterium]
MIGMSQIRKKLYTGIAIGAAVGIVGIGITLWWSIVTIKSYEAGTNVKYNQNFTKEVCFVNKDVVQGQTISAEMLTMVRVRLDTIPTGAILDTSTAVGKIAKYNIAAYTSIIDNMLTDKIIDVDTREQEINAILMPSDLVEGDFVDIRIMFSNGTDYIVLAAKQVNKISGQTMWFSLKEAERLILNSAMVDSYLNKGTKLYATIYADSDSQVKFTNDEIDPVEGALIELIKLELPELATLAGIDKNTTEPSTDKVTEGETTTAVQSNAYVDKVLNFIIKYNNLTASTSKTVTTYQPNDKVNAAMRGNINISKEATNKLSQEARDNIENLNKQYEVANEEKIANVVSGAQTSISEQQSVRKQLLGTTAQ